MNEILRRRRGLMAKKAGDLIYQLDAAITTATKDPVSTGLKLLESDIDFTIMISATTTARDVALYCCPITSAPWYNQAASSKGIYFGTGGGVSANGKFYAYGKNADIPNFGWSTNPETFKVVITHEAGTGAADAYYNIGNNVGSGSLSLTGGSFASQQNTLSFKMLGTVSDLRVYSSVKTLAEINTYLGL